MERGGKLDGRALGWGAKEWHVRAESEVGERICEDFWRRLLQLRRMRCLDCGGRRSLKLGKNWLFELGRKAGSLKNRGFFKIRVSFYP
ncbi:hypothetical protein Btaycd_012470 [Bartonella taylorii]|nr:hypothetical protein Btaycd_012470 [Bartonella taylorii]